jgi:hypothetical protein
MVLAFRKIAEKLISIQSDDNKEQTYLKYWLDLQLSRGVKGLYAAPQADAWVIEKGPLFTGILKRWVDRAVVKRDVAFCYTLQKGTKRMWPALGDVKVDAAYKKHENAMRGLQHGPLGGKTPPAMLDCISAVSRSIFPPMPAERATKFLPTGSACMQISRRKGGNLSLIDPFPIKEALSSSPGNRMGKLRHLTTGFDTWRQREFKKLLDRAELESGNQGNGEFRNAGQLDVKAVHLMEPGKIRMLSLGNGVLYSALQPLQGYMLSCWKARAESTMERDDLTARVQEIDAILYDQPYWCSVDYESATDLLKSDATIAAFSALRDGLFGEMGWKSLFTERVWYPTQKGSKRIYDRFTDVKDGQLMGHPLSFPLLCAINLAVYLLSIDKWIEAADTPQERSRRTFLSSALKQCVLVNGDDMLFKCELSLYHIFMDTLKEPGFKVSQGKQYLSADFCMINSQIFLRQKGSMVRKGYLNMKLILGTSLKGGESQSLPTQITRDLNKMIELTPWTNCAIPKALSRFGKDWFGKRFQPNWYLPVHLGGLGLDPKNAPPSLTLTKEQRVMAANFIAHPELALYRKYGEGHVPIAKMGKAIASWHWDVAPEGAPYVPRETEDQSAQDSWMARVSMAYRGSLSKSPDMYTTTDEVAFAQLPIDYRLKPMSDERIAAYSHARLFCSFLPACPPLGTLRAGTAAILPKINQNDLWWFRRPYHMSGRDTWKHGYHAHELKVRRSEAAVNRKLASKAVRIPDRDPFSDFVLPSWDEEDADFFVNVAEHRSEVPEIGLPHPLLIDDFITIEQERLELGL